MKLFSNSMPKFYEIFLIIKNLLIIKEINNVLKIKNPAITRG